jgi:hypothetical protein
MQDGISAGLQQGTGQQNDIPEAFIQLPQDSMGSSAASASLRGLTSNLHAPATGRFATSSSASLKSPPSSHYGMFDSVAAAPDPFSSQVQLNCM